MTCSWPTFHFWSHSPLHIQSSLPTCCNSFAYSLNLWLPETKIGDTSRAFHRLMSCKHQQGLFIHPISASTNIRSPAQLYTSAYFRLKMQDCSRFYPITSESPCSSLPCSTLNAHSLHIYLSVIALSRLILRVKYQCEFNWTEIFSLIAAVPLRKLLSISFQSQCKQSPVLSVLQCSVTALEAISV